MKIFKLKEKLLIEDQGAYFTTDTSKWHQVITSEDIKVEVKKLSLIPISADEAFQERVSNILPPISQQDVWAAGVTYFRSRSARMEESEESAGAIFYTKVYEADRPELFMKATARQVVGHGGIVNIRTDSSWNVPEPELTLLISPKGKITGYTIGNDMSSRSIEGENPLYLPQAKVYDGSAAIGPCILVLDEEITADTTITLQIDRDDTAVFTESTQLSQMKRSLKELAGWLYRECSFPYGCFLMTGTGIVPDDFTLETNDIIKITIEGIGTLENRVGERKKY